MRLKRKLLNKIYKVINIFKILMIVYKNAMNSKDTTVNKLLSNKMKIVNGYSVPFSTRSYYTEFFDPFNNNQIYIENTEAIKNRQNIINFKNVIYGKFI